MFNPVVHIIFVAIGFAFFLWQYIKYKYTYQLILLIWIPLTLTQYISQNKTYLTIIGVFQMILFIVFVFFLVKKNAQVKREIQNRVHDQNTKITSNETQKDDI